MYVFRMKDSGPKVRLVALGCRQVHGVDFGETYAPVVKYTSIRILLATVAVQDLELHQMYVVTAFLHGELDKDIFMQVPDGLRSDSTEGLVCRLKKALYGLKQAPRLWHAKIDAYLIEELNFVSSRNDPCVYVHHTGASILIIALYVDDLLIAGSDSSEIAIIKGEFAKRFEMKDLGEAKVTSVWRSLGIARRTFFTSPRSSTWSKFWSLSVCKIRNQSQRRWSPSSKPSSGPILTRITLRPSISRIAKPSKALCSS